MEIEEVNVMSKAHREPVAKCREQTLPLAKYKFWLLVDIGMDKYDECAERINITLLQHVKDYKKLISKHFQAAAVRDSLNYHNKIIRIIIFQLMARSNNCQKRL